MVTVDLAKPFCIPEDTTDGAEADKSQVALALPKVFDRARQSKGCHTAYNVPLWGRGTEWQLGHQRVQFRKLPCADYSLHLKGRSPFVQTVVSLTETRAGKGHASLQGGLTS